MTAEQRIPQASRGFPQALAAIPYAHRLHASQRRQADVVLAADKISKAREMGLESEQTRQSRLQQALARASRDRKLAHHRCCLDLLEQLLTDSPLVTQLRTELENAPGIPNTPPTTGPPTDSLRASTKLCDHRRQWAKYSFYR